MKTVHELFLDLFRNIFSATEMMTVNAGLLKGTVQGSVLRYSGEPKTPSVLTLHWILLLPHIKHEC
jgi:hypothetical protein